MEPLWKCDISRNILSCWKFSYVFHISCVKCFCIEIFALQTHINYNLTRLIGADNGLAPTRRQPVIWTNDGKLIDGYKRQAKGMCNICNKRYLVLVCEHSSRDEKWANLCRAWWFSGCVQPPAWYLAQAGLNDKSCWMIVFDNGIVCWFLRQSKQYFHFSIIWCTGYLIIFRKIKYMLIPFVLVTNGNVLGQHWLDKGFVASWDDCLDLLYVFTAWIDSWSSRGFASSHAKRRIKWAVFILRDPRCIGYTHWHICTQKHMNSIIKSNTML